MHEYLQKNLENVDLALMMEFYGDLLVEIKNLKLKLAEFNEKEKDTEKIDQYSKE